MEGDRSMKKVLSLALVALLVIALFAGCSQGSEKKVVIASKPMTEQFIIVEMMKLLIENETDIQVEMNTGIAGGTSNIHPAMMNGEVDMYPEYSGTGWMTVLKQDLINDPMELYTKTQDMYASELNMKWMEPYGFNNTYALAVRSDDPAMSAVDSYTDLANASNALRLGAEYDFYEREDGYPALSKTYGFDFAEQIELEIGLKYKAIGEEQVDVINAFSTDGLLKEYNLKVLKDDKNFFPSYMASTVVRQETLDEYPELEAVLAKLAGAITDEEMIELNYRVDFNKEDPSAVAEDYLKQKGLL